MSEPAFVTPVDGRVVATCKGIGDADKGCRCSTILSGLLYVLEVWESGKSKTSAVRSCPRCNRYLQPKDMVAIA